MKILLDECIDSRLTKEFTEYFIKTVPQMGWATVKNGKLLALAEKEFDVFITVDRNLSFQQNITNFNLSIVVLRAKSNRVSDLKPLVPEIITLLPNLEPRLVKVVGI